MAIILTIMSMEERILPLKAYLAQDAIMAAREITPDSIVAQSINGLRSMFDARTLSAERSAGLSLENDLSLCQVAVMEDARRFIADTGLISKFKLKKTDACFDFFENCVAEAILVTTKKKEPLANQVGIVLGRVKANDALLDAVLDKQAMQNKAFIQDNRGTTCGKQAHDIQFLVRDLFGFLGKLSSNEQGVFPVNRDDVRTWTRKWRRWGVPVSDYSINRKTVLLNQLPPRR